MKTYLQLSVKQQEKACNARLKELLEIALDGGQFYPELDAKINAAATKANAMDTPWFWGEYIMDTCRTEFEEMARMDVEMSVFAGESDFVLTEPRES